ncbi:NADH:ubiquinone reductase (Na(+)-transporting) subunit B [Methylobacter sp. YRD-M1]|uniref:NADH:ubiquinone reductase (Na(+)-transporting) subunit B n=1 Tax=Methylobacter sp. YRD-M1 TaxID=2911520 RepID=UPI00227C62EF|nr:NADH:ubiquinone reductase (Na(+)-transporting) subunit B [Methylobacter sp. YRD-M1]WAK00590.1 NADH:ubiquinone reductase (Na(+)-transporting) subunit B [Methylobacter sp. YRD-M1]
MSEEPGKFAARFVQGGKWEKLGPLYDAVDTFLYTPGTVTRSAPHVRDALDMKRMMVTVIVALIPTVIMAFYNTGLQINLALQQQSAEYAPGWRGALLNFMGVGSDPASVLDNMLLGALYFLPVYIFTLLAGGFWEVLFAIVRQQTISEGFLVTSLIFTLILPPDIPWWQVMMGISFGVVIGKEIFGGVGMNILNPALVGRCFLFFSYPKDMSGNAIWVPVDGYSRATPLAELPDPELALSVSWQDAFYGFIPGSMGETSTLACLIGALILIVSRVGSWRIMAGVVLGMAGLSLLFNYAGSPANPMFQVTPQWHLVLGGFAFGTVYVATDPVSAAHSLPGQFVYGLLIGVLTVLVRVINPGFPEGIMLAILFGNVFAPTIDRLFISRHIRRRQRRIDAQR